MLLHQSLRVVFRLAADLMALSALMVIGARIFAPWPPPSDQYRDAAVAVVMALAEGAEGSILYLALEGADPDDEFMEKLRAAHPTRVFRPISKRSSENDRCAPGDGFIPVGACQEDDSIKIRVLAAPLWRTTLVSANTAACYSEFTLVRTLSRTHVASHRWICS